MIKSMTAYGKGECDQGNARFNVEIRSVNHRYRDVVIRTPKVFQVLEDQLRSVIASRVGRGRLEVTLQKEDSGEDAAYELELNVPLAKAYLGILDRLSELCGSKREISLESLTQMKDVILVRPQEVDLEQARAAFSKALGDALDSLDTMRLAEGRAIEADFLLRLDSLEGYAAAVRERAPIVLAEYRARLKERVEALSGEVSVDQSRLAQEVAIFAERSDIAEEMVRLDSHVRQFREYLAAGEAVGRRLDFLIQEMNREVNTMASKALDPAISGIAVEMKSELEKLREQVQNVE